MSQYAQVFFGYDGVIYADRKRMELLDQKIKTLETELARLRRLRMEWSS